MRFGNRHGGRRRLSTREPSRRAACAARVLCGLWIGDETLVAVVRDIDPRIADIRSHRRLRPTVAGYDIRADDCFYIDCSRRHVVARTVRYRATLAGRSGRLAAAPTVPLRRRRPTRRWAISRHGRCPAPRRRRSASREASTSAPWDPMRPRSSPRSQRRVNDARCRTVCSRTRPIGKPSRSTASPSTCRQDSTYSIWPIRI